MSPSSQVEEVDGEEEGVDGVADESVAVRRRVRSLAHDPQHALVTVLCGMTAFGIWPNLQCPQGHTIML